MLIDACLISLGSFVSSSLPSQSTQSSCIKLLISCLKFFFWQITLFFQWSSVDYTCSLENLYIFDLQSLLLTSPSFCLIFFLRYSCFQIPRTWKSLFYPCSSSTFNALSIVAGRTNLFMEKGFLRSCLFRNYILFWYQNLSRSFGLHYKLSRFWFGAKASVNNPRMR